MVISAEAQILQQGGRSVNTVGLIGIPWTQRAALKYLAIARWL